MKKILMIISVATVALLLMVLYSNKSNEANGADSLKSARATFESYLVHNPVEMKSYTYEDMERPDKITKYQAIEDITYFFDRIQNGYGGYEVFGGIEKFNVIRNDLIDGLTLDMINVDLLSKRIIASLDFIQDAHFIFDRKNLVSRQAFYTSSAYVFTKVDQAYTFVDDGVTYYLTDVRIKDEPMDLEAALFPVIDEDGQERYQLGMIKPIDKGISIFHFNYALSPNGEGSYSGRVILQYYKVTDYYKTELYSSLPIYTEEMINGVKVIQINNFMPENETERDLLRDFANSFSGLTKDTPVILDLRFSTGGNSSYTDEWALQTFGVSSILGNYFTAFLTEKGWSESSFISQEPIKNDIPIYVLTSVLTGSTSEGLTKFLRNVENVTFIGENTMGCQLVGNVKPDVLPNSKIQFTFGSALFMEKDLKIIEGIGFLPDFWADPITALERTILYVNGKHVMP